jgi:transcriptional regulator with XRE-family HTH domain
MARVDVSAIGAYIKEQREQAKISLRQLAQSAGISNPYLSQIERGLRRPSADILQQIAKGLRISAEALYVQAGFLEDRPPGSVVREAVLTDEQLTERQKQMLIEIYESFRKETALARAADIAEDSDDESDFGTGEAELSWPEDVGPEALRQPRRLALAARPAPDAADDEGDLDEADLDDADPDEDNADNAEDVDGAAAGPAGAGQAAPEQGGTIHPFPRLPGNR